MAHGVRLESVPGRHVAAVRERRRWTELGAALLPLLDLVYVAVRAGAVVKTGGNEVYGHWQEDESKLETEVFYALAPRRG